MASRLPLSIRRVYPQRVGPPNFLTPDFSNTDDVHRPIPESVDTLHPRYHNLCQLLDLRVACEEEAAICAARCAEILAGSALKVHSDVPKKRARVFQVILNEAEKWEADMIVVGSHGTQRVRSSGYWRSCRGCRTSLKMLSRNNPASACQRGHPGSDERSLREMLD